MGEHPTRAAPADSEDRGRQDARGASSQQGGAAAGSRTSTREYDRDRRDARGDPSKLSSGPDTVGARALTSPQAQMTELSATTLDRIERARHLFYRIPGMGMAFNEDDFIKARELERAHDLGHRGAAIEPHQQDEDMKRKRDGAPGGSPEKKKPVSPARPHPSSLQQGPAYSSDNAGDGPAREGSHAGQDGGGQDDDGDEDPDRPHPCSMRQGVQYSSDDAGDGRVCGVSQPADHRVLL